MAELTEIRRLVEEHGTPSHRVYFLTAVAAMNDRRDRYVVCEETLDLCRTAVTISLASGDQNAIISSRFDLGFNLLWRGDLDQAEQHMQVALALAEETGNAVHQSRCLTYLTILYRKRGQPDKTSQYASRSLAVAKAAEMIEYVGTARANLAWVAWQEGDLAQAGTEGRAALELWQQLPVGHSLCPFQWTAIWPLVATAAAQDQTSGACAFLPVLLESSQQRLPEALSVAVENAVSACKEGDEEAARTWLDQAVLLARELAYL
jgi:tetratricopeptide (TPR) repeat protein